MIRQEDETIAVGRENIDYESVLAIVNELIASGDATYHIKRTTKQIGTWPFVQERVEGECYYRLSNEGVELARELSGQPRIHVHVNGNMHLNSANHVVVQGDAYIAHVEQLMREDLDFKRLIEQVCAANIRSVAALERAVYGLIVENAALKRRVESRGWSLFSVAIGAAKFVAKLLGLHIP
jgi:hypothetical protein